MLDELTNEWGEPYRNPPCEFCELETNDDGDCEACQPRVALEDSPVRASFTIAPPVGRGIPGVVRWSGWCAP